MWDRKGVDGTTPKRVQAKIETWLEQGVTTMDRADIYGGYLAEEIMGAGLTQAIKDQIEIVTKCNIFALCLLYPSPSPRDRTRSRMLSSA